MGASMVMGGVIQMLTPQPSLVCLFHNRWRTSPRMLSVPRSIPLHRATLCPFCTVSARSGGSDLGGGHLRRKPTIGRFFIHHGRSGGLFMGAIWHRHLFAGAKVVVERRMPVESPDDLQSNAKIKILLALSEGEIARRTGRHAHSAGWHAGTQMPTAARISPD